MSRVTQVDMAAEVEIQRVARGLWEAMRGETPSAFRRDFWVGRVLDWSMQRPELKVDLFRLVDVLPVLGSSKQIQQHVVEYLGTGRDSMPRGLGTAFRLATSGLPSVVTAKAVQKSVREMALRFIVAEDLDGALPRLRALHEEGIGATIDLLGEVTLSYVEAQAYHERYLELIERLPGEIAGWGGGPVLAGTLALPYGKDAARERRHVRDTTRGAWCHEAENIPPAPFKGGERMRRRDARTTMTAGQAPVLGSGDAQRMASGGPVLAGTLALPAANVSIKLSALEPRLSPVDMEGSVARLEEAVLPLLIAASERGVFINLDMEQWALHEITLRFLERALEHPALRAWPHIGIAIQAYAKSAQADLERLVRLAQRRGAPITVRLVKGAYWDYEVVHARQHGFECPVFQNKSATDANFEALSRYMLEHIEHLLPAFGSHNLRSVAHALVHAEMLDVPPEAYEFQVLYGMAEPLRAALRERGYRVRVYAPVGKLLPGMAYLVRRLLENTSNEGFLRMSYQKGVDLGKLLAKPEFVDEPEDVVWAPPPELDAEFVNCPHLDFTRDDQREALGEAVGCRLEAVGRNIPPAPFKGGEENIPPAPFKGGEEDNKEHPLDPLQRGKIRFPLRVPVVINGKAREGVAVHRRVSPNDGRSVVAEVQMAGPEDVEDAVQAAMGAWPGWRDRPVRERAQLLEELAARLHGDRHRLAALQTHEVAKPWRDADGDVCEAIDFCRYYARRAIEELSPQPLNRVPGEDNLGLYEGRGPTVVIAPWNFPLAILCGMTTAALVSGNPVIMKPAEQSSAIGYALFEHMLAAGFPPEVVQFVPGYGEEIGPALVSHPLTVMVAFTGSKAVGLSILEQIGRHTPGQAHIKRAICEMGGKNAIVVDDDADLDEAVAGVIDSSFGYAGQKCSAGSRVIVVEAAYEAFLRRLVEASRSLVLAPATDPGCDVPPVVDEDAYQRLLNEIETARAEMPVAFVGAAPSDGGYFVPPMVVEIQDIDHRLVREELFGPILAVTRAESFEDAIAIANASEYALTGAVFSRTPSHLDQARAEFRVGNLYLNRGSTGAMVGRQPFGGFKMSGTDAKAGGPNYLMHFVDARCVTENTMRRGFTPDVML